jgi:hypothetical protein
MEPVQTAREQERPASPNGGGPEPVGPVARPLRLGEVLAETTRLYGARIWVAAGLGAITAASFVAGLVLPTAGAVGLLALSLTACWAAATRLVVGDSFTEAWAQVAVRAPALLVLTVVATVPFALALTQQFFLVVFAVLWLAGTGFAIPVAVMERPAEPLDFLHRLGWLLRRSLALARAEFFHAAGVIAALVILYLLLSAILFGALRGFAENGEVAAAAIAQAVLAPFFFLGLAVLYFEQRARALSSRGGRR